MIFFVTGLFRVVDQVLQPNVWRDRAPAHTR